VPDRALAASTFAGTDLPARLATVLAEGRVLLGPAPGVAEQHVQGQLQDQDAEPNHEHCDRDTAAAPTCSHTSREVSELLHLALNVYGWCSNVGKPISSSS
jgi:hypothetical protein